MFSMGGLNTLYIVQYSITSFIKVFTSTNFCWLYKSVFNFAFYANPLKLLGIINLAIYANPLIFYSLSWVTTYYVS